MLKNPIELSKKIEAKIIKDGKRFIPMFIIEKVPGENKYTAAAYSTGCNVRCYYCASLMRDYLDGDIPDINLSANKSADIKGGYYSPQELLDVFVRMADSPEDFGVEEAKGLVDDFEILDCETSIGMKFILELLELLYEYNKKHNTSHKFHLFSNGIILGESKEYIKKLEKYKDCVVVRISIKAGNAEEFAKRLDIQEEFFEYPFLAIEECVKLDIPNYVAVLCDKRIMLKEEYEEIKNRLRRIGYKEKIFEESLIMSVGCVKRIKKHHELNPDYKFNFRFRKSLLLVDNFPTDESAIIIKKISSGIRRVIGKKQEVCTYDSLNEVIDRYLKENKKVDTILFIDKFSDDKVKILLKNFDKNIYKITNEIIILNSSFEDNIQSSDKIKGNIIIRTKNLEELAKAEVGISDQGSIERILVAVGSKITYYWTEIGN